jgi:predicted permease
VTPDYFRALNIPILRGRGFSEEERSSNDHFILVSQALASRMFPGEDAIGKRLQPGLEGPWYTIVGIAANAKNGGLANENKPEYYRLRRNRAEDWASGAGYNEVVITGPMNSEAMAQWVRSEVAALDPTVPVEIETMEQRVSKLAERPRFQAAVLSLFAAIALLLAAIGIYGMASYSVAQRTREIGVRMAVGATRSDVLRMVAARAARVIGTGGALGLIAALIATRILAGLLFGIVPSDPLTYGAIALLLIVVALLATWVPARSATRINPMKALRYE